MQSTFNHYGISRHFQVTVDAAIEAVDLIRQTFLNSSDRALAFTIDLAESQPVQTTCTILTSPEAKACYRFLGKSILAVGAVLMYGAFIAGVQFHSFCDRLVDRYLIQDAPESNSQLEPTAMEAATVEAETEVSDEAIESAPGKPNLEAMSREELRAECRKHGIKYAHAKGRDRHLSAAEMREALQAIS